MKKFNLNFKLNYSLSKGKVRIHFTGIRRHWKAQLNKNKEKERINKDQLRKKNQKKKLCERLKVRLKAVRLSSVA